MIIPKSLFDFSELHLGKESLPRDRLPMHFTAVQSFPAVGAVGSASVFTRVPGFPHAIQSGVRKAAEDI